MRYIIFTSLIFLCINVQAQTIINVDSSNTINIYNNGTLIENNQGTVNIGTESGKEEELRMPDDLGKVTEPKDKKIHFIYTDDYKFAGDKVKIEGKVYKNVNVLKSISGKKLFKIIGNETYGCSQTQTIVDINDYDHYVKGNILYVSKYKNCNDEYDQYYIIDNYSGRSPKYAHRIKLISGVVIDDLTAPLVVRFLGTFLIVGIITIIVLGMILCACVPEQYLNKALWILLISCMIASLYLSYYVFDFGPPE